MRLNLNLQQLQAFSELARTKNFRNAAQALGVSQPALSRTIKTIEEMIGERLFDRDTRRVEITPTGRELLPIAARILENFESSLSELSQFLDGRNGHITVAALPSVSVALLPRAIARFVEQSPGVQFSFVEGSAEQLRDAVVEGRADFALSVRPHAREPLHYHHLFDDPFVLVCRKDHALAARDFAVWSDFAAYPFIASARSSSIRPITDAAFIQKRLNISPALEYPSIASAGALVGIGLGITALPALAMPLIHHTELITLPLRRPAAVREIGLVTRVGRSLSPATRAFMEALHQSVAAR